LLDAPGGDIRIPDAPFHAGEKAMQIRSAAAMLTGLAAAGALALMVLPSASATQTPFFTKAPIADPPKVACDKQMWPNTDRRCLSWTAPR
jgi:hypothetical protein